MAEVYCATLDDPDSAVVIQREPLVSIRNVASPSSFVGDGEPPTLTPTRIRKITLAIVFGILTILAVAFIALYFSKDQKSQYHNDLKSQGSNRSDDEEMKSQSNNSLKNRGSNKNNVDRGRWVKIANDICIGARDDSFKDVLYPLGSSVIGGMKLVHTKGAIGCDTGSSTYWGCVYYTILHRDIGMYITSLNNNIIFPSKISSLPHPGGWYKLPGYTASSPELVFTDFDYLKFFKRGQKLRVWYGEDLFNYSENNNHGTTCMDIWVYIVCMTDMC